jgi:hypothetical protein
VDAAALAGRLTALAAELDAAGAPDEALGEFLPSRGFGPFATAEKFRALGRAWRLGVLLLDRSGQLYSVGEVTRAIEPGRAAVNRSALGERRRSLRLAAARSFPKGEVVNFTYVPIDSSEAAVIATSGPLSVRDGAVVVELEPGAFADLDRYLAERTALLVSGDPF